MGSLWLSKFWTKRKFSSTRWLNRCILLNNFIHGFVFLLFPSFSCYFIQSGEGIEFYSIVASSYLPKSFRMLLSSGFLEPNFRWEVVDFRCILFFCMGNLCLEYKFCHKVDFDRHTMKSMLTCYLYFFSMCFYRLGGK